MNRSFTYLALSLLVLIPAALAKAQPDTNIVPLPNTLYNTWDAVYRDGSVVLIQDGEYGLIRSMDSGKTFESLDAGVRPPYYSYFLANSGPIWRASSPRYNFPTSLIEFSRDNGSNWIPVIDSPAYYSQGAISKDGHAFTWLSSNGSYYIITDIDPLPRRIEGGSHMSWCDSLHGIAFAQGSYLKITSDGGRTWRTIFNVDSNDDPILDYSTTVMYYTPALLIAQNSYDIWMSRDSGHTWSDTANIGNPLWVVSPSHWLGVVSNGRGGSAFSLSTDSGHHWVAVQTPFAEADHIAFLSFSDTMNGMAFSGGRMELTTDGGFTWKYVRLFEAEFGSGYSDSFTMDAPSTPFFSLDDRTCYTAGIDTTGANVAFRSLDRGADWNEFFQMPESDRYYFHNDRFYFIHKDSLLWTTDGASYDFLWSLGRDTTKSPPDQQTFVKFGIDNTVWAGTAHSLSISTNLGDSWGTNNILNLPNIADSTYTFIPVDVSTGFASEANGGTYETNDGGLTWQATRYAPTIAAGRRRWFRYIDTTNHYITTNDGGQTWDTTTYGSGLIPFDSIDWVIIPSSPGGFGSYTMDAGITWQPIPGWINLPLASIDSNAAFFSNGSWLLRLDMPWYIKLQQSVINNGNQIQSIGGEHLSDLRVTENPFTNTTAIKFTLGDYGLVTFQLFDVLGHAVTTNGIGQVLYPGAHEFDIDGSKLAPGTYIARLAFHNGDAESIMVVRK